MHGHEDSHRIGVYVHVPFCQKKCAYCDFYSLEKTEHIAGFVEYLRREVEMRCGDLDRNVVADTLFIGGGTPSLLSEEQFDRVYDALLQAIEFAPNAEQTMECNPGTVSDGRLEHYRSRGINRLSFGAQSFQQSELHFLDRLHEPEQIGQAIASARRAGFDNVSLDLIFAIPGQTMQTWQDTVKRALDLRTDHISAYALIFEEGTPLYTRLLKGQVSQLDEELNYDMYLWAIEEFRRAGYEQYEVSNFAQAGRRCRHNLRYWHAGEYLAFGPSAHGYLASRRYKNLRSLSMWKDALVHGREPISGEEQLTKLDKLFEAVFLRLRADGLYIDLLEAEFGVNIMEIAGDMLRDWENDGLVASRAMKWFLTPRGYALCDEVSLQLISRMERAIGAKWNGADGLSRDDIDTSAEQYVEIAW